MFGYLQLLLPVILLWYGWKFYKNTPGYMQERGAFPTRRAKESEEMWINVHRIAGVCCFGEAVVFALISAVVRVGFPGSVTAYWVQIALELVCIFALVPVVNAITERKYPEK